jgi:hypothetical protein
MSMPRVDVVLSGAAMVGNVHISIKGKGMRRRNAILLGILMLGISWIGCGDGWAGVVSQALVEKTVTAGTARVVVQLAVATQAEGTLASTEAVLGQRRTIAVAQTGLLTALAGLRYELKQQFRTIPFVALEVTPEALEALRQSASVVQVTEDRLAKLSLAQSASLVEAD